MHEDHRNDGNWVTSTQHSVDESQQQQRGERGGFAQAFRSLRSHTRVAPPSPHALDKRTCAHIVTDTNPHKWEGDSVQQRPHAGITDHTRHNSDASLQPPTQNKKKLHVLWNIPAIRKAQKNHNAPFLNAFVIHIPNA
ncbi:hypothetical protein TcG_09879 [Trypanosoma cruzi]|nr:hypothetical protein TcG_09879 [Trypanosoma cruzi]